MIDLLQTKIRVVSRETGQEVNQIYLTEPLFFLHTINAYEDSNHLVVDICCYKDPKMLDCMYLEALRVCFREHCLMDACTETKICLNRAPSRSRIMRNCSVVGRNVSFCHFSRMWDSMATWTVSLIRIHLLPGRRMAPFSSGRMNCVRWAAKRRASITTFTILESIATFTPSMRMSTLIIRER